MSKVILISGGGGAIGSLTGQRLAARGYTVVLADMDKEMLERAAAGYDEQPLTLLTDVTSPRSCADAVRAVLDRHGRLDAVWANAGISGFGPVELMDSSLWRRVVEVNLVGAYNLVSSALPHILAVQGYVALTASWAAFAQSPGHSAYASSKAGLEAFANGLRSEVAHQGVDVGVFFPGWIRTPMVTEKEERMPAFTRYQKSLPGPLRSLADPEDLAGVLAQAIDCRKSHLIYPRTGLLLNAIRAALPGKILSAAGRKAAPEIRQAYADQLARDGAAVTGMSARYRAQMRQVLMPDCFDKAVDASRGGPELAGG